MLKSTEIYAGVKWNIVESAVLPYAIVWSKITNFDERILLFGKFMTKYAPQFSQSFRGV